MYLVNPAALLSILLAVGTAEPKAVPTGDLQVIQAVLTAHYENHHRFAGKAVLLSLTRSGPPVLEHEVRNLTSHADASLLAAFRLRNKTVYTIPDEGISLTLADSATYTRSDGALDWDALERDIPGVVEVVAISVPGYGEDGRAAIVEIDVRTRERQSAALYYLEMRGAVWVEKGYVSVRE